jgi:hypothetical protein
VLSVSGYTDDALEHHGVLEFGTAFVETRLTVSGHPRKVREVLENCVEDLRRSDEPHAYLHFVTTPPPLP